MKHISDSSAARMARKRGADGADAGCDIKKSEGRGAPGIRPTPAASKPAKPRAG